MPEGWEKTVIQGTLAVAVQPHDGVEITLIDAEPPAAVIEVSDVSRL